MLTPTHEVSTQKNRIVSLLKHVTIAVLFLVMHGESACAQDDIIDKHTVTFRSSLTWGLQGGAVYDLSKDIPGSGSKEPFERFLFTGPQLQSVVSYQSHYANVFVAAGLRPWQTNAFYAIFGSSGSFGDTIVSAYFFDSGDGASFGVQCSHPALPLSLFVETDGGVAVGGFSLQATFR